MEMVLPSYLVLTAANKRILIDTGEYPQAIQLLTSGAIRVKPLITAVVPLEDGRQWFERLYAREPNLMKVVLTPGSVS